MKLSFNKIRSAFGNKQNTNEPNTDNQIEDIINAVDGDAFAVSEQNVLFAKTSELGGYFYVIALIVGSFKIKTNKGAKLNIKGNDFELLLNSDSDEFESEHSNIPKRYVTRIDFQIEEEDVSKFDHTKIKSLQLSAKKQEIVFKTI
ncbi:hypothetical protein [Algibacter sp. R77976]|uniref:hypothetical protein n=1 Tax=Algibacter sp. R77976 TaxID=3093873 RepID=UPI0037C5A5D8